MNVQIERHKPLITKRIAFTHQLFPPPPKISRRMEFSLTSGRLRNRSGVEPSTNIVSRYRAITPSPMDIDDSIPNPRRSNSPASLPSSYVDRHHNSTVRGATRFSRVAETPPPMSKPAEKDRRQTEQAATAVQGSEESVSAESPVQKRHAVRFGVSGDDSLSSVSEDCTSDVPRLIPKPRGQVGRPKLGGYNLQETLGWSSRVYESVVVRCHHLGRTKLTNSQDLVHKLTKEKLDLSKSFSKQEKKKIVKVCEAVRHEYAILKDYEHDWPVRDMLQLHLKYTAEASRRTETAETAKKVAKVRFRLWHKAGLTC